MKIIYKVVIIAFSILLAGCAPEKGSKEWCKDLAEKPKGDWSSNDAKEYTKFCVLKQKPE